MPKSLENNEYSCKGCKYKNIVLHGFNCADWKKEKITVFDYGWTMFDDAGFFGRMFDEIAQNYQLET